MSESLEIAQEKEKVGPDGRTDTERRDYAMKHNLTFYIRLVPESGKLVRWGVFNTETNKQHLDKWFKEEGDSSWIRVSALYEAFMLLRFGP